MKKRILTIVLIGMSLAVKAQDETVNGRLTINSNADVGRGQNPSLLIGSRTGHHIDIDGNEIGAFNNNNNAVLYLNGSQSTSNTIINGDGTGNVGIRTMSPSATLHINSNADVGRGQNPSLLIGSRTGHHIDIDGNEIGAFNNNNNAVLYLNGSQSTSNTIINGDGTGNVGIRTMSPSATLHINSNADVGRGQNPSLLIGSRTGHHIDIDGNEIGAFNNNNNAVLYLNGSQSTSNTIINGDGTGNVGIGTMNPHDWRLAVNGKIRAKEIKVETGWADFVFYNNYKLPTLQEVENHIKENGHLKDIPSAKEVKENGIFLGEMNSKLLQKIEELTLYTIAQEKKINNLEKDNESLKFLTIKFLELQKRLEKLEKK